MAAEDMETVSSKIVELEAVETLGMSKLQRYRHNKEKRRLRMLLARLKGSHTDQEWHDLVREFGGRCVRCGIDTTGCLDKDHIVPIYQGGSDGIDNLQPLCCMCNVQKGPDSFNWVQFRRQHGWCVPNGCEGKNEATGNPPLCR